MKRYPCHVTAQPTVQALRAMMREHGFAAGDVAGLSLRMAEKVVSHHDIRAPRDVMSAQYSVPFCAALALHRDPEDPRSFDESALVDAGIRRVCGLIDLGAGQDLPTAWSARIEVALRDGRRLQALARAFTGMPEDPPDQAGLRRRFALLTEDALGKSQSQAWYGALADLENQPAFPVPA